MEGRNVPEAWENSIVQLWMKGVTVQTEYGNVSKDCTMLTTVREPLSEPRIHKAGLVVGKLSQLEEYVSEVCDGIHDSYVRKGAWPYTYHERLFSYDAPQGVTNQFDYMLDKLSNAPYSRRAQAITWKPWFDTKTEDPPCLQRVWVRIYDNQLVMETCWRSRDAMKAAFMNMYALTELQSIMAEELSKRLGRTISVGDYIDFSNSYHLYEPDFSKAEGLVKRSKSSVLEDRVWTTAVYNELVSKETMYQRNQVSK